MITTDSGNTCQAAKSDTRLHVHPSYHIEWKDVSATSTVADQRRTTSRINHGPDPAKCFDPAAMFDASHDACTIVVWITSSSRSIGRALCSTLAKCYWKEEILCRE
jgi:hypothetical protein